MGEKEEEIVEQTIVICNQCKHCFRTSEQYFFDNTRTVYLCKKHPLPAFTNPLTGEESHINHAYEKCECFNSNGDCGEFEEGQPKIEKIGPLEWLVRKVTPGLYE